MGIKGLLPVLEHTKVPIDLEQLKGKRIAIDGHCWLHNGLTCCAYELETGVPTDKYVTSFRKKVLQLLNCGVIPVVVFDGKGLPLKAGTVGQREKRRKEARDRGFQYLSKGDRKSAYEEFRSSAKITPAMINNVIKVSISMLDSFDVEHIIAPYEADPQLAHLCRTGYVNAILTMDSDLLAFDCPHIIFQRYNFDSLVYIQHASLFTKVPDKSQLLNLTSFTPTMFRHMCILSGCDYVENMSRFGMKSAYKFLKSGSTVEQIVKSHLGSRNTLEVANYMTKFQIAEAGFLYQIVYDPKSKSCIRLNALPDKPQLTKEELSLLGTISNMKDSGGVNSAQQKQKDSRVEKESKNQTEEPAVVPDTYKSSTIAGFTEEEEEEEICPSLSTTKDEEEEEEELLSTPAEVNLSSFVKVDNKSEIKIPDNKYKGTKTPLQDTTNNNNNNKMTAHELASSFKQRSTSSFIRQKSVLGSLKKIQSTNTRQTTVLSFFGRHKLEKKRKPEEMSKSDKSNETVHALLNNKRFK